MGSPLVIHMLGSWNAQGGDVALTRLPQKAQWLLALLVLRHERAIPRAWLAETLWPDSAPSRALANLRELLTDMRLTLGTYKTCLLTPTPRTLCLDMQRLEVDLIAFQAHCKRGDREALEQAIALYRGPLLEGCQEEWILAEREACKESYFRAREILAAHAVQGGDPVGAAQHLHQVIALDPLRESTQRQLLQALAQNGDFAAVTQVYRDLRALLRQELNVEPDIQTRELYERLRADVRQQDRSRSDSVIPPPAPGPPPVHLPIPLTPLIGRYKQRREIAFRLINTRLLTLVGAGGIGKTRLAIESVRDIAAAYLEGVWFVDLSALAAPNLIPQAVATALGVHEESDRELTATLEAFLFSRSLLLVLDNCEHLHQESARLIVRLLGICPHLRILATSRQSFGIPEESVYHVPALSLPDRSTTVDSKTLCFSEAGTLFLARAQAVQERFTLTEQNAETIARICWRLDGIPLAIELAAARINSLSVQQIAARLDDRFRLLTQGNTTALPRQQTLQGAIAWSYDLLNTAEQTLLQRLSVFADGFTLDAVETVCSDQAIAREDILDLLSGLVSKSLVVREVKEEEIEADYRLLESIRQFNAESLQQRGDEGVWHERHREYFLVLAEQTAPMLIGAEQAQALTRLERAHDNLRAVLDRLRADPRGADSGLRMAGALWRFWYVRGYPGEGRACLTDFLASSDAQKSSLVRARALQGAAGLAYGQQDYVSAQTLFEESSDLYREWGDRHGEAHCLNGLSLALSDAGKDMGRARMLLEKSLTMKREFGDFRGVAYGLNNLANQASMAGEYGRARMLYEESLTVFRALNPADPYGVALALVNVGLLARYQSDYPTARTLLSDGLQQCREFGDKRLMAQALENLGVVTAHLGDSESARPLIEQSLRLRHEMVDRLGIAQCLEGFASLAVLEGNAVRAACLWGAAEELRHQLHLPLSPAEHTEYERERERIAPHWEEVVCQKAWHEGRSLILAQAIAYALT